ncbi:class I SAM-dependent methyltransferase [Mucilaginibacter sp. dw_454]|uniref:class I SAM-dependent methyltransferase n=1 Tax=Mucilaginibacter sp. dw_454 TaxID=2720079 RepID=UPI001BD2184C|nr:class I SAM-dependent methyltransferase [Mucilaginibacter sp. dw_454]
MPKNPQQTYGNIDIYLFDQLLKGTYENCTKVLDIGCGTGRNLIYFLKNGYEVFGVDQNPDAIRGVQGLAAELSPQNPTENFSLAHADNLPFADDGFDLLISSAVLHFARNETHFNGMISEAFRVLKPGGYFFARLASDIGIEELVTNLGDGRYLLPDGSTRYLVNQEMLLNYTQKFGRLYEPIKTTNVQNLRCMTTWCIQKL